MAGVRQFDEPKVLEEALALFWRKGFRGASMQELAAATGVQRGSLYNAYQDKETLFLRVFGLYCARTLAKVREELSRPELGDALRGYLAYVIDSMTTGEPTRGCLSTKTALAGDELEPPVREALRDWLAQLEGALRERLAAPGGRDRLIAPVDEAARLLTTFARGLVVMERIYQDKQALRASADAFVRLLVTRPDS